MRLTTGTRHDEDAYLREFLHDQCFTAHTARGRYRLSSSVCGKRGGNLHEFRMLV
jgi:hypothetical protein